MSEMMSTFKLDRSKFTRFMGGRILNDRIIERNSTVKTAGHRVIVIGSTAHSRGDSLAQSKRTTIEGEIRKVH